MREFTLSAYKNILESFREVGYTFTNFENFLINPGQKTVILRHDVDRFPIQTLKMARMEAELGISATYYFRIIPAVYKPEIIKEVVSIGHEIGYHYEDLSLCKGDVDKSIKHFENNLERLRNFYLVKTICMHGSPLSKWDNKTIWKHYDYRQFGILADTSFDIDYNKVFYISDNGRAWNRTSVSVRDKVDSHFNIPIKNSDHLIELVKNNQLPAAVMINAHPDTFFDFGFKYLLNWGFIEAKNIAKWVIVKYGLRK